MADNGTEYAKSATSGTCNDTTFGLITVLGVIDPGYGCVVALRKLLRGRSFGRENTT
jgi:hypothetical protein